MLLVLKNDPFSPGLVGEWAQERGHALDVRHIGAGGDDELPDPEPYELIVVLGSRFSAYEEHDWLERELAYMREAVARDAPVFGICFGAQLLARSLGAEVHRAGRSERGWTTLDTDAPELVPAGPWMQWHRDVFDVPQGASLLARTDVGPQAFRHGRSLGVQFHPDATPAKVARWCTRDADLLAAEGRDPAAIVAETERHTAAARELSFTLFDRVLAGVS